MGWPNCSRVSAYLTVMSRQRRAPPYASAARRTSPASRARSIAARPAAILVAGAASSSTAATRRVMSVPLSGVTPSPRAPPSTSQRPGPSPSAAATRIASATAAWGTRGLRPLSVPPCARVVSRAASHSSPSSPSARVTIARPRAMAGSQRAAASALPLARRAAVASAQARNGPGVQHQPSSSAASATSSSSSPEPPCAAGTWSPGTPSSASPSHRRGSCPPSLSMTARTRVVGHSVSSQRRIVCLSRTWSGERPKSMSRAALLASLPRVARQPEAPLGDDVALDVGGAARDQHAERPHVGGAEHAHRGRVRLTGREQRAVADHVQGEVRDVVAQGGRGELHHQCREPRLLAARAQGEEAVALVLVGDEARLELHQPAPHHGILDGGPAAHLDCPRQHDEAVERPAGEMLAADQRALVLERRAAHHPALAPFPDQALRRHAHVVEEHLVEVGVPGHLAERPHLDAGRLHVDQEVADAVVLGLVRLGAGQGEPPVGLARARGPDLLAVDDPRVALEHGARAERGQVAARARLAVALAPAERPEQGARDEASLLRFGAVLEEGRHERAPGSGRSIAYRFRGAQSSSALATKRTVAIEAFRRSPSTSTRMRRTATSRPRRSSKSALSRSPWIIASN